MGIGLNPWTFSNWPLFAIIPSASSYRNKKRQEKSFYDDFARFLPIGYSLSSYGSIRSDDRGSNKLRGPYLSSGDSISFRG